MTGSQAAPTTHRRRAGRPRGGVLRADRGQLLDAAQRAIASIGPDATMDQIAAEAQVSKPIVYRMIGDRAALVDSLSDILVDRIGQSIEASIDVDRDPAIGFTVSLRAYLAAVEADRNLFLFVNGAGQRSEPLRARIDRAGVRLVELFSAGADDPGPDSSASTWAHAVVGALQTVTLMWLEADPAQRRGIDDVAVDMSTLLWPGISAIVDTLQPPTS